MSEQISARHRFTNWHETELEAHIGSLCVILLKRHAWSQTSTSAPPRLHLGWENKSFSNRDEYQERTGWNQISSPASLSDYGTKSVEHRLFYLPSDHPYLPHTVSDCVFPSVQPLQETVCCGTDVSSFGPMQCLQSFHWNGKCSIMFISGLVVYGGVAVPFLKAKLWYEEHTYMFRLIVSCAAYITASKQRPVLWSCPQLSCTYCTVQPAAHQAFLCVHKSVHRHRHTKQTLCFSISSGEMVIWLTAAQCSWHKRLYFRGHCFLLLTAGQKAKGCVRGY